MQCKNKSVMELSNGEDGTFGQCFEGDDKIEQTKSKER